MVTTIFKAPQSDTVLAELIERAQDAAEIYKFAKKTQTGCDGLNELLIVQAEFRDIVDEMIEYC